MDKNPPEIREMQRDTIIGSKLDELLCHWESRTGQSFAPTYAGFSFDSLSPRIIPQCAIIDSIADYRFRFFGTALTELYGAEYTGKRMTEMMPAFAGDILSHYVDRVKTERSPIIFSASLDQWLPGLAKQLVSLCLPLSNDGTGVTHVVARFLEDTEFIKYEQFLDRR